MRICLVCALLLFSWPISVIAQTLPDPFRTSDSLEVYTILRVDVEGVEDAGTRDVLARASGLRIGQAVSLPGDPAFSAAIRSIYRLGEFDQVSIRHTKGGERTVFVTIQVEDLPMIEEIRIAGVKRKDERALRRQIDLLPNSRMRPSNVERARRTIQDYMAGKGYDRADVTVSKENADNDRVNVVFRVQKGPLLAVQTLEIIGAEEVSERTLRKVIATKPAHGLKFWSKTRFDEDAWRADQENVVAYLHEKGYYDARIVGDSVYVEENDGKPGLVAELTIHEGRPYYIRNVLWEGNTKFSDEQLSEWLSVAPGDRYNRKKLEENLYGNADGTDVSSRYMNDGYMRFQVKPTILVAEEDSLDVHFDLFEGGPYDFGTIEIAGNSLTKDHVVRRELLSIPGEPFSRVAIQESMRRLAQIGYLSESSMMKGPEISVDDEEQLVDMTYTVEESSAPKPQLSGTFGQFGLVLGVGLQYNNFSLQNAFRRAGWKPLPSGDGQSIGFNVQANGKAYQQYGFNFTEPWFRGKPAPIGLTLSYAHISSNAISSSLDGRFNTFSASLFHERRLKWPGPRFSAGAAIEYQTYSNTIYDELPQGTNRKLSYTQSLTFNTTNHPIFPTRGAKAGLSVEVGLPVQGFIQYHKWRLQGSLNLPLSRQGKLSFNVSGDMGYVGSITGGRVEFERFVLGGSPLDAQGIAATPVLGTDVVYFRGYPLGAFERADDSNITGDRVLNKYSAELRWAAVNERFMQATPYLFFDMANTWSGLDRYRPFNLYRSAGAGLRVNVPMFGLLEIVYGRNLDAFGAGIDGQSKWRLQFSIGRSFNF